MFPILISIQAEAGRLSVMLEREFWHWEVLAR